MQVTIAGTKVWVVDSHGITGMLMAIDVHERINPYFPALNCAYQTTAMLQAVRGVQPCVGGINFVRVKPPGECLRCLESIVAV